MLGALTLSAGSGIALAGSDASAACDALAVPSLDLTRCVVDGDQPQIDAGNVVRMTSLSNDAVHWLAGHRTSHGSTFNRLTSLQIGSAVWYRDRLYIVTDYQLVDRYHPDAILDWIYTASPSVVLQTSASGPNVHVWRAIEYGPSLVASSAAPPLP